MKLLNLFVDESGSDNPKKGISKCYIVCGCLVSEFKRNELKIRADQIKFKYWGRTDIVFHSREIGRKEGNFSILKDKKIYQNFQNDLFNFLSLASIQLFVVLVNHKDAIKQNWNSQKIYKETAGVLIKNFILALLAIGDCRGKLIVESASAEKDFVFHKTAGYFLSNGIKELNIGYKDVQNVLTEISFVSKKNYDIEEQIADLLAYGAKLKFLKGSSPITVYKNKILKIMEQKVFRMNPETSTKKKRFYSLIEGFTILP